MAPVIASHSVQPRKLFRACLGSIPYCPSATTVAILFTCAPPVEVGRRNTLVVNGVNGVKHREGLIERRGKSWINKSTQRHLGSSTGTNEAVASSTGTLTGASARSGVSSDVLAELRESSQTMPGLVFLVCSTTGSSVAACYSWFVGSRPWLY